MDANEIIPVIAPGNDMSFIAKLWKPSGAGKAALTAADGAATGWLSLDPATDTPADAVLTVDVTWLDDATHPEYWRITYNTTAPKDAALLAVVAPSSSDLFLVVKHDIGVRRVCLLEYRPYDFFAVS